MVAPISCLLLGGSCRRPVWPVQWLTGAQPRSPPSGTSLCEELELQGLPCNLSVTGSNSNRTQLPLAQNPEDLRANLPLRRGRAPVFSKGWAVWATSGPVLFISFLFLFVLELKQF
jgi:hypothetical protein